MPEILIMGGGFAGLWAALVARRTALDEQRDISITLVSKDAFLTMRPRLYEADPERFHVPLRPILEPVDIEFIEAEVTEIETDSRRLTMAGSADRLSYEQLVLTAGSVLTPISVPGEKHAFNLDTWSAAMDFEQHLRQRAPHPEKLTVVVIGAGFTGIEIAMNLRDRIQGVSDAGKATAARIILLDHADVVGRELGSNPRPVIEAALADANIEIHLGARVSAIDPQGVDLVDGTRISSDTTLICTGQRASPLTRQIEGRKDPLGRLETGPDLRVAGYDNIFAAGDVALAQVDDGGHVALMSCQHAMMMGRYAGHNVVRDRLGLPTTPYRQERYVTCLDLGSAGAVFTRGWDRVVEKTGMEAKQIKQNINGNIIYPPGGDRSQILDAATLIPAYLKPPPERG